MSKTRVLPVALLIWASAGLCTKAEAVEIHQQVVFRNDGHSWYRIPSLAAVGEDTILAFASRRRGSPGDFGHETDVVMRRSTDGGRTFGPMRTLVTQPDTDIHHGSVVVDRQNDRILKFCRYWPATGQPKQFVATTPLETMRRLGYLDHVVVSDDLGATWSAPRPIPMPYPAGSVSCGTGNGNHGIQLAGGRLLIQGGFIPTTGPHADEPHMCVFYSDDGGVTWKRGATMPFATIREFAMARGNDGTIAYNFRANAAGGGYRMVSWGTGRGLHFGRVVVDKQLPCPHCHAALLRLTDMERGRGEAMLFANPNRSNKTGRHSAELRREMTVRFSADGGRTWSAARALNQDFAGYADLAQAGNGGLHCLYESGRERYYDSITYARFTLDWVRGDQAPVR